MPNDRDGQRAILSQALASGVAMTEPGSIVDLDFRYIDDDWKAAPLSWSRRRQTSGETKGETRGDTKGETRDEASDGTSGGTRKPGADSRTGRSPDPVWQNEADAAAAKAVDWDEQCLVCVGIEKPG